MQEVWQMAFPHVLLTVLGFLSQGELKLQVYLTIKMAEDQSGSSQTQCWLCLYWIQGARLDTLGCRPGHTFLEVGSTECSWTYFRVNMHRLAQTDAEGSRAWLIDRQANCPAGPWLINGLELQDLNPEIKDASSVQFQKWGIPFVFYSSTVFIKPLQNWHVSLNWNLSNTAIQPLLHLNHNSCPCPVSAQTPWPFLLPDIYIFICPVYTVYYINVSLYGILRNGIHKKGPLPLAAYSHSVPKKKKKDRWWREGRKGIMNEDNSAARLIYPEPCRPTTVGGWQPLLPFSAWVRPWPTLCAWILASCIGLLVIRYVKQWSFSNWKIALSQGMITKGCTHSLHTLPLIFPATLLIVEQNDRNLCHHQGSGQTGGLFLSK